MHQRGKVDLGRALSWWALPQVTVLVSTLPEALQRFLVLIYPGLVGPVTMVSCSILALTHLLFEFKGNTCFFNNLGRKNAYKVSPGWLPEQAWSWEGG